MLQTGGIFNAWATDLGQPVSRGSLANLSGGHVENQIQTWHEESEDDTHFVYKNGASKAKFKLAMEESSSSHSPENTVKSNGEVSASWQMKTRCLSFAVSVREMFSYTKATILGQARYFTSRNEEEAAKAELLAAKMQVEAANSAENAKKKINKAP
ncbi:hypothetical protein QQ045_021673 [Rhodiola kirilowii]